VPNHIGIKSALVSQHDSIQWQAIQAKSSLSMGSTLTVACALRLCTNRPNDSVNPYSVQLFGSKGNQTWNWNWTLLESEPNHKIHKAGFMWLVSRSRLLWKHLLYVADCQLAAQTTPNKPQKVNT